VGTERGSCSISGTPEITGKNVARMRARKRGGEAIPDTTMARILFSGESSQEILAGQERRITPFVL
jgi:hypothetical protein